MAAIPAHPSVSDAADVKDGRGPESAQGGGPAVTGKDVRAALAGLNAQHRQVIVEIYYHHRSVAETADVLGIRASSVVSLAYSAVRQLPDALAVAVSCRAPAPHPATAFLHPASSRSAAGSLLQRGLATC